jgi:hypothetical protein
MLKAIMLTTVLLLAGCHDTTAPRDTTPPAAPRGLYSITGDHEVTLRWLPNTESDVAGYRVFEAACASGPDCPFDPVGSTTGTEFRVEGLTNGVTRFFAVAAYDLAGNESALSGESPPEDVFDTPRPAGVDRVLDNYLDSPSRSGYDFSAFAVVPYDADQADIFFGARDSIYVMFTAWADVNIQDAGYASSLDAVDFAPSGGWAPSGTAEMIAKHCYVVETGAGTSDHHYAKFRVTSVGPSGVTFDWAYQIDPGNRELAARPVRRETGRVRRPIVWPQVVRGTPGIETARSAWPGPRGSG